MEFILGFTTSIVAYIAMILLKSIPLKEKLWEIEQLQARIAELEAEVANLNDWLTTWKESFSLAQAEIAKLKADNCSLVEQMNEMALEMGGKQ